MSEYLARCALKGVRPKTASALQLVSRPHIVAHLLRERHALRVISAPFGFGKRSVALEYAQTVWQFNHVFWMEATSPCFLRDLDAGLISKTLLQQDAEPFLLVILDVPHLDTERSERLIEDIRSLLSAGCEVIVTCTPSHDVFNEERLRLTVGAQDLLLNDREYELFKEQSTSSHLFAQSLPDDQISQTYDTDHLSLQRIACFAWGDKDEREFLKRLFREDMPLTSQAGLLVALMLKHTEMTVICGCCHVDSQEMVEIAKAYAVIAYSKQEGVCHARDLNAALLCEILRSKSTLLSSAFRMSTTQNLITSLSEMLLTQKEERRACELVQHTLPSADRAVWLAEHAQVLHEHASYYPAYELYMSLGRERGNLNARLDAIHALCLMHLKQYDAARRLVLRLSKSSQAQSDVRVVALLILSQLEQANNQHEILLSAAKLLSNATTMNSDMRNQLAFLVCFRRELADDLDQAAKLLFAYGEKGVHLCAYYTAATWFFEAVYTQGVPHEFSLLNDIVKQVLAQIELSEGEGLSRAQSICIIALKKLVDQGLVCTTAFLDELLDRAQLINIALLSQQKQVEEYLLKKTANSRKQFTSSHAAASLNTSAYTENLQNGSGVSAASSYAAPATPGYPLLTVNLLGGLEVFIGQQRVAPEYFRRQKIKTLLALLVLNKGKEYSRDRLVEIMWPGSSVAAGRKGLYSLWSKLREALMTPDGECPYLIRQQQSLRLDATLLRSDVMRLEAACESLLFEQPTYEGWPALLTQVNKDFSEEILPSDNENSTIEAWRSDYRCHLVDALINASTRLYEAGRPQESLWFARAALQRDRTREDAYVSLVRAQLAVGQRTAALEACQSCRRYLTDELGIDPSGELMRLYRSIVESEEVLV